MEMKWGQGRYKYSYNSFPSSSGEPNHRVPFLGVFRISNLKSCLRFGLLVALCMI